MARVKTKLVWAALAIGLLIGPGLAAAAPGEGFDVTRYDLALTPDIPNGTVAGREVITLRVTQDGLQRLDFSGNGLTIDKATLDGVPVTARSEDDGLGFALGRSGAGARSGWRCSITASRRAA
jgi:aminopeptidase N